MPGRIAVLQQTREIFEVSTAGARIRPIWNNLIAIPVELQDWGPVAKHEAVVLCELVHLCTDLLFTSAAAAAEAGLNVCRGISHAAESFRRLTQWAFDVLWLVRPHCDTQTEEKPQAVSTGRDSNPRQSSLAIVLLVCRVCEQATSGGMQEDALCCWSEFSLARRLPCENTRPHSLQDTAALLPPPPPPPPPSTHSRHRVWPAPFLHCALLYSHFSPSK
jgi:hypothetical protein